MSARESTSNLDIEYADPAILEKIESQHVPGELTPGHHASPAMSAEERLDDSKLEKGSLNSSAEAGGREPITHRPTGLRVFSSLIGSEFI
jgi:hypothetical protein